jgi:hypothetical protein
MSSSLYGFVQGGADFHDLGSLRSYGLVSWPPVTPNSLDQYAMSEAILGLITLGS